MSDNSLKKGRYTRFSNKIGLYSTSQDRIGFLNNNDDVILSFPFKDTVLEAGMNQEDTEREERFLHHEVDGKDIDTLFEPKVLTNFQHFSNFDSTELTKNRIDFFDNEGNLKQNLLIKGNNLLVLHSLSKCLAGQVKLIYIDPPYYFKEKKTIDAFKYNSNFKLSSWLIFMKNRLEVARDLLADDGVILVNINEDGNAYLKILMNEIFGRNNFVETFIWKNTDNPDSLSKKSRSSVEYIIAFEKNIDKSVGYSGKQTENGDAPLLNSGNKYKPLTFPAGTIKFNIPDNEIKKGKPDRVEILNDFTIKNGVNEQALTLVGEFKWSQETLNEELRNGTYFLVKSDKFSIRFQRSESKSMAVEKFIDEIYLSKAIGVGTNEDATSHLKKMGIDFTNAKPESLVSFFIKAVTNEGDLVLDFFLGSGTTCAAAHKTGRRWIGVEQMDYIKETTKERMKKVIDGEQGGISKAVGWQGGGSFVYFELKKYNQDFLDKIMAANSKGELDDVYTEMAKNAFLKFWFDKNEFEKDENFRSLDLDQRKELLIGILDENQLYLNHADMRDSRYHVTDEEMALTDLFYGANND
ncbi:site-specific DNA-methyltransferase [Acinetobacter towneri]|uniref:site-specific DNA-methyltransferase n=1 Tax=Acinetobacter towneri TaxID=202956 RepID=UPI001D192775|nr:site-specific DNA-methyltransferase [Acinetobacter towneri]